MLQSKNDELNKSGFHATIGLAQIVYLLTRFATQTQKAGHVFTKQFDHIDAICDAESVYDSKLPKQAVEGLVFK